MCIGVDGLQREIKEAFPAIVLLASQAYILLTLYELLTENRIDPYEGS